MHCTAERTQTPCCTSGRTAGTLPLRGSSSSRRLHDLEARHNSRLLPPAARQPSRTSSHAVRCSAQELVRYDRDLFTDSRSAQRLLERALPEVVRNLSRAPFLALASQWRRSTELIDLPRGASALEQVWAPYLNAIADKRPDIFIFVHEVPSATASSPPPRPGQAHLEGKLGDDCCGDERATSHEPELASHIVPFMHPPAAQPSGGHASARASGSGGQWAQQRSWGLVVRTLEDDNPVAGCYLLSTVQHSDPSGCTCVHYSATRVRQGESLHSQLVRSWLV